MHNYLLCLIVETFLLAKVCFSAFELTLKSFMINLMGSESNPEKSSHFSPSASPLNNHKGCLVASDPVEHSDCNFFLLSTLKCLIYPRNSVPGIPRKRYWLLKEATTRNCGVWAHLKRGNVSSQLGQKRHVLPRGLPKLVLDQHIWSPRFPTTGAVVQ